MRKLLFALMTAGIASAVSAAIHIAPAAGSGNGLSWTLGQSAVATFASADNTVFLTQGILQAPAVAYSSIGDIAADKTLPTVVIEGDIVAVDSAESWTLFDSTGRRMASGTAARFSVAGYREGVYILSVEAGNGFRTFKKIIR